MEHASPSRQEEPPFLLNFPSPFLDDIPAPQLLSLPPQPNHLMADQNTALKVITEPTPEIKPRSKMKSRGKKDRHSKIHTAHGLRCRRMRLSIHIARKFFDLQDLLGFDRASQTLDWLFLKSKKAIKEVTQMSKNLPSNMKKNNQGSCNLERAESICESRLENITAERNSRKSRKSALNSNDNPVTRESREKARARARQRTIQKMMNKFKCNDVKSNKCEWLEKNPNSTTNLDKLGLGFTANPNYTNMDKLGYPNITFEPPSSNDQDRLFMLEDQLTNVGILQKYLAPSCSGFGSSGKLEFNKKSLNFLENRAARNLRINSDSSMAPFIPINEWPKPSYTMVTSINMNFQHLQEGSLQLP